MVDADRERVFEVNQRVMGRVRDRMAELEISVTEITEKLGIGRSAFYKWMEGRAPLSIDRLTALEVALKLPYGELLRLAGKPAAPGPDPVSISILGAHELQDHQKRALLHAYESYLEDNRQHQPEDTRDTPRRRSGDAGA